MARARGLALLFAGLVVATVVFELYLRIVEAVPALWRLLPAAEVALYGPDPDSGYTLRPSVEGVWLRENRTFIRTSAQGLRDHETTFAKPPGTFRIALAGDSITEALQVDLENTFAVLLERNVDVTGRKVEVINLGLSGAVPPVQAARMDRLGARFDPDLLLYLVNVFDFSSPVLGDDHDFPGYVAGDDGVYRLSHSFRESGQYRFRMSSGGQVYYWLLDRVRIARVINARRNAGFRAQEAAPPASAPIAKCDPSQALALTEAFRGSTNEQQTKAVLSAFLRDVARTSEAIKAPAVIAVRGLMPRCPEDVAPRHALAEEMARQLRAHGIALIDLDRNIDRVLREEEREMRDLYGFGAALGDGHLNEYGHRVFTTALERGLVPWLGNTTVTRRNGFAHE